MFHSDKVHKLLCFNMVYNILCFIIIPLQARGKKREKAKYKFNCMDSVFCLGGKLHASAPCTAQLLVQFFVSGCRAMALGCHEKTLPEFGTQNVIANKRLILNQSLKMHCTYSLVCNKKKH